MRTNSPIDEGSDSILSELAPKPKIQPNDWERLAKSGKYKDINAYFEQRKEHHRRFLPGGIPVQNVPKDELAKHWEVACMVLEEIEMIQGLIANQLVSKNG